MFQLQELEQSSPDLSVRDITDSKLNDFFGDNPEFSEKHLQEVTAALDVFKELSTFQWKQLENFSMTQYNTISPKIINDEVDDMFKKHNAVTSLSYVDEGDIEIPSQNRYLVIAKTRAGDPKCTKTSKEQTAKVLNEYTLTKSTTALSADAGFVCI